jgi:AcrR family transcriptional regulator
MSDKKSPKQKRKEKQRKIRRNHIVNVAEQAFIEHGYDEAKVDQIALDAGYTKATIYNYFESKDDLYAAVLANTYQRMHETLESYLNKDGTPYEIQTLGEAYLEFVNRYPQQSEFIDSGRCITINRVIIEKELEGKPLTESEIEFRENETGLGSFIADIILNAMKQSSIADDALVLKIVKSLAALNPLIRGVVRRGKAMGQSDDEIRETLSILFKIIEQGVKYYDE